MTSRKTIAVAAVALSVGGASVAYALTPQQMSPAGGSEIAPVATPIHDDGRRGWHDRGGRGGRDGARGWRRGPEGRGGPGGHGMMGGHGIMGGGHGMMGQGGHAMMMVLRLADTNEDGSLSQEEVDAFVAGQVSEANADGADGVTLDEFQTIWLSMTRPMMVRTFQFFDTDGDAVISQEEIDDRFANIVEKFDRNGDGQMDRGDRRRGGMHHRGRDRDRGADRDAGADSETETDAN